MKESESPIFVNTQVDAEVYEMLISMAKEDGFENSRSAFIRQLIRHEYARRYSAPQPLITIERAEQAAEARDWREQAKDERPT